MTTDPAMPAADPTDLEEQRRDVRPAIDDPEAPARDYAGGRALEADEGDVAEQRAEVPDDDEDDARG